ncbi:MAG TPA: hypothetical protein PKE62_11250 [Anaerolineales bacterium]|nr:hypothetical protein [Anaerolineales bacterium]
MDTIGLKSQNAASTGDSESANGAAKSATAAHSRPSRKSGKKSTFRTLQNVTPNEAAQILLTALNYCRKAGLSVTGYNEANALRLSIDGIHYDFDGHTMITLDGHTTPEQVTP